MYNNTQIQRGIAIIAAIILAVQTLSMTVFDTTDKIIARYNELKSSINDELETVSSGLENIESSVTDRIEINRVVLERNRELIVAAQIRLEKLERQLFELEGELNQLQTSTSYVMPSTSTSTSSSTSTSTSTSSSTTTTTISRTKQITPTTTTTRCLVKALFLCV